MTNHPATFCKYLPAATGRAVLDSGTLRWSSPVLFNDPFDVPRELSFGISPQQIVDALAARLGRLLDVPPPDSSALEPKLRLLIDTVRRGIPEQLRRELISSLNDVSQLPCPTSESMDQLREMWRQWVPDLRILCLTESPAHAAMWYHYADRYAGVVLEFHCNITSDSPWRIARPVEYLVEKPAVYPAEGWAELLTLQREMAVNRLLDIATYTKVADWAYEKEWRVVSFKRPDDVGDFTDYRFNPNDLATIYLGPKISESDRADILALATDFPNVRVCSVSLSLGREFVFDNVSTARGPV